MLGRGSALPTPATQAPDPAETPRGGTAVPSKSNVPDALLSDPIELCDAMNAAGEGNRDGSEDGESGDGSEGSEAEEDQDDMEDEDGEGFDEEENEEEYGSEGSEEDPAAQDEEPIGYRDALEEILADVSNDVVGLEFAVGGFISDTFRPPAVRVEGIGRLGFPLCEDQAARLIKAGIVAPYGKGIGVTVVDTEVRKAWKIEGSKVNVSGKTWNNDLARLVTRACEALGVNAAALQVQAHLHDLLLYEAGGHFKPHRDTEKEPGMFGTLIVQLPAEHTGAVFEVQHNGITKRFEHAKDSADECYFTAFYGDCEHTVRPVESGHRLVLVYNLVRTAAGLAPSLSLQETMERRAALQAAAKSWAEDWDGPEKLACVLDHLYTEQSFGYDMLKGSDKKVVDFLCAAADDSGNALFEVFLVLMEQSKVNNGWDDLGGDEDEDSIRQIRCVSARPDSAPWMREAKITVDLATEKLGEDSIFCHDPVREEADEDEFQGNEGPTITQWYNGSLVVFWPRNGSLRMLCKTDQEGAAAKIRTGIWDGKLDAVFGSSAVEFAQAIKIADFLIAKGDAARGGQVARAAGAKILEDRLTHVSHYYEPGETLESLFRTFTRLQLTDLMDRTVQYMIQGGNGFTIFHALDPTNVPTAIPQLVRLARGIMETSLSKLNSWNAHGTAMAFYEDLIRLKPKVTATAWTDLLQRFGKAMAHHADLMVSVISRPEAAKAIAEGETGYLAMCRAVTEPRNADALARIIVLPQAINGIAKGLAVYMDMCRVLVESGKASSLAAVVRVPHAMEAISKQQEPYLGMCRALIQSKDSAALASVIGTPFAIEAISKRQEPYVGMCHEIAKSTTPEPLFELLKQQHALYGLLKANPIWTEMGRALLAFDKTDQLRTLLRTQTAREGITKGVAIFVDMAIKVVKKLPSKELDFTWAFSQASYPQDPEVEAFLQGPNQHFTKRGFSGIAQARSFESSSKRTLCDFNLIFLAEGMGKNAHVSIR